MINIAVCDDDVVFMKTAMHSLIKNAAKNAGVKTEVSFFTDGAELIQCFENGKPYDIVVLDIDMPAMNGKEIAQRLRSIDRSFFLVFVTSFRMEIFNTVRYGIYAFIPKDSELNEGEKELTRVFTEYSSVNRRYEALTILKNGIPSVVKISPDNILAFSLSEGTIYMKTSADELILEERIFGRIAERFIPMGFFETHRGHLVNISHIQEITDKNVILSGGSALPLSKRSRKPLIKAFSDYILIMSDN